MKRSPSMGSYFFCILGLIGIVIVMATIFTITDPDWKDLIYDLALLGINTWTFSYNLRRIINSYLGL